MTEQEKGELYAEFENIAATKNEIEIKKALDQFDVQNFADLPIVFDLITNQHFRLLQYLHQKGMPLTYIEYGPYMNNILQKKNALHVVCGGYGGLEYAKFFIENNIWTNINERGDMG